MFKNASKEKDTHADYRGSILIGGREYWLSAWIKTGARGKFMSLSAKPKDGKAPEQSARPMTPSGDFDETVPF